MSKRAEWLAPGEQIPCLTGHLHTAPDYPGNMSPESPDFLPFWEKPEIQIFMLNTNDLKILANNCQNEYSLGTRKCLCLQSMLPGHGSAFEEGVWATSFSHTHYWLTEDHRKAILAGNITIISITNSSKCPWTLHLSHYVLASRTV